MTKKCVSEMILRSGIALVLAWYLDICRRVWRWEYR